MTEFEDSYIREAAYRPFVATNCYGDHTFLSRALQLDQMFPENSSENRVICLPGKGSKKPFSALIVGIMPDLGFNDATRCFPRYSYQQPANANQIRTADEQERIDNISDTALEYLPQTTTAMPPSPKTTSSITFTASYTRRVIARPIRKRPLQNDTPHPLCPRLPHLRRSRESTRRPPPQLRNLRTISRI